MTIEAEEIAWSSAKARQMAFDLNQILAALVEEGCDVLVEVENRIAKAEGYKMTKTPRIHLRILKEVE